MSFEKIENAKVRFQRTYEPKVMGYGIQLFIKSQDGKEYTATFSSKSQIAKIADSVDNETMSAKLNGGTYIFNNNELIDFRFSHYEGFSHTEDNLNELGEKIGFSKAQPSKKAVNGSLDGLFNQLRHKNGVFLGGPAKEPFSLDIEGMGEGGAFKNRLIYKWSPFNQNVMTTIEVERLICANGMVGMSDLVTNLTPVISDIESNLEVIEFNLRPRMNSLLSERFAKMSQANNRASVADVLEANRMIQERMRSGNMSDHDYQVLRGLAKVTDAEQMLKGVFSKDLFTQRNGTIRQAPSNLTKFDLFNIMTEMGSHVSNDSYSNRTIQYFINKLVFDNMKNEISGNVSQDVHEKSSPDRVFFGKD